MVEDADDDVVIGLFVIDELGVVGADDWFGKGELGVGLGFGNGNKRSFWFSEWRYDEET